MELLAPAGSPEAVTAAVQSGADAIYLGYGDFNARRNAKNFSQEELRAAVFDCHLRGVKVYLTLNTLLHDRELPIAAQTAALASELGVDAVLVQDLGVAKLVRETCPDLPLHGSTQMTLHSLAGVEEAARLGMTRAVLARELPREEIAAICKASPIEIEVFVHGALCMCYSGQCFLSSLIGGRSGNRGLCAQPCRLPYRWAGAKETGYPLSLKDLSLAGYLGELTQMGVACLKLEGRMKRPEYVAIVTQIYVAALREGREPTREEQEILAQAFSRQGFTQGYYLDQTGPGMFGVRQDKTQDPGPLFAQAKSRYQRGEAAAVPVDLTVTVSAEQPVTLEAADEQGRTVTVHGPIPEPARNRAVTREQVAAQIAKTGGTVFACRRVEAQVGPGLSLPLSAFNALRRKALEALAQQRSTPPQRRQLAFVPPPGVENPTTPPVLTVSVGRLDQVTAALLEQEPAVVYLPLEDAAQAPETVAAWVADYPQVEFAVTLPRIVWDREAPRLRRELAAVQQAGINTALAGTLGPLSIARQMGFALRGDYGLGVCNSLTLGEVARLGLCSATVSFELKLAQIRDLSKVLPTEALVYGRLPLMLTENCIQKARGCPCGEEHRLQDRKGAQFPVRKAWGCRSELYNAKTLYLADKPEWQRSGLWGARLHFTTEDGATCAAVFADYQAGQGAPPQEFTRGLYYREVE